MRHAAISVRWIPVTAGPTPRATPVPQCAMRAGR
jgi:hypothetical protein